MKGAHGKPHMRGKKGWMMYPSRSERKKSKMKAKQAKQLRVWTFINLGLIIVITFLLVYHFSSKEQESGVEPSLYDPSTLGFFHDMSI